MSINKEAISNPIQKLEEIKPQLFELYKKDYHQEDTSELKKRWDNTIFMTEVLPEEEKEFIRKYGKDGYSRKKLLQLEAEYLNYKKEEKRITKEIQEEFAEFLKKNYKVPQDCKPADLWNLDFCIEEMEEDPIRQNNYKFACLNLGIDPITTYVDLITILLKKEQLKGKRDRRRIEETRWGMRIQNQYPMFSPSILASIFFDDETSASTSLVRTFSGEKKTVCYIPLMRYVNVPSLDRIVLHELRHVVETTEDKTGLTIFKIPRFDMVNEIRTERNAMKDEQKIPMIFGRNNNRIQSVYEILLREVREIEDFEDAFNIASFAEDYGVIEGVLEKDLTALENVLQEKERKKVRKIKKG